jgi:hypothetical protein
MDVLFDAVAAGEALGGLFAVRLFHGRVERSFREYL